MRGLFRLAAPLAILAALPFAAAAQTPFDGTVKLGVLDDQSSLYQDTTGPGSVAAVKMAAEDYLAANPQIDPQAERGVRRSSEQARCRLQYRARMVRARRSRRRDRRAELGGRPGGHRADQAAQQGASQRLGRNDAADRRHVQRRHGALELRQLCPPQRP